MSYLSTQLRDIYTEVQLLKEIGEGNAKPYPFKRRSEFNYTFMAKLGQNSKEEVKVDFEDLNNEPSFKDKLLQNLFSKVETIFNIGYKVNDDEFQFKKIEMGLFLRIMSTVSLIIQDFIKENNPDLLYITGSPRELGTEDESKNRLYKIFIWKQLSKAPNYIAEPRMGGYVIFKKGIK
jgi:hypothetical protein